MRATIAAIALAVTPAGAEEKSAVYAKDIAFFLDEFESKAGHFFEQKGIEWDKVRTWANSELSEVKTDNDHRQLCTRLVARLQDGHARLRPYPEWPDESEGRKWRLQKIGMILEGERALVTLVDPSLEIPIGSEITAIAARPAHEWIGAKADEWSDRRGYSTRRHALASAAAFGLSGWEGTTIKVAFSRPDGTKGEREVDRSLGEHSPVRLDTSKQLNKLTPIERGNFGLTKKGNGYIQLAKIPGDLPEQLDKILPQFVDAPGLILDMRGNGGGGCDHYAVFARFIGKGEFWGKIEGVGTAPYPGPMVVIIDGRVASAGETVAGQFGEDQRALLIGPSPTAGMSSQKVTLEAPSKLCSAYFSVRSNKGRFNRGKGIEGIGVIPHITVPYERADLAAGIDTQIKRAEELLEKRKWPEHIDYEPPEQSTAP